MVARTHDQNTLLFGSQNGICDECGFKFKQVDLRKKWDGLVVCRTCWEPRNSSDLYNYLSRDDGGGVGSYTRPTDDMTRTGTDIKGNSIPASINITTLTVPDASEGEAYSEVIETDVVGLTVTWSVSAGSLPTGTTLDTATGIISGTLSAAGAFSFTIQIEVPDGRTDTQAYTMDVLVGEPTSWTSGLTAAGSAGSSGFWYSQSSFADGDLLVLGGSSGNTVGRIMDYAARTWSNTSTIGVTLQGPGATQVILSDGDTALLMSRGTTCATYVKSTDTWKQVGNYPHGQQAVAAAVGSDGKVYTFGSWNTSTGKGTNQIYVYDPVAETWSASATTMSKYLAVGAAVSLSDGRIFFGGGIDRPVSTTINYDYWIFDPSDQSITYETTVIAPHYYYAPMLACQLSNGNIYIGGGGAGTPGSVNKNTSVYNLDTQTWAVGAVDLPYATATYRYSSYEYVTAYNTVDKNIYVIGMLNEVGNWVSSSS